MRWYEWSRYIRDHCDAPSDVKAFLLYLATYADGDGHCFPAYPRLARVMGVATSTVQRRRQRAVELGWLETSGGRWRGDPTHYRLVRKGTDGAHLPGGGKVPTKAQKGTDEAPGKVPTVPTERSITFQEGADGASSLESARPAQTTTKRERVKEAIDALSEENVPELSEKAWLRILHDEGFEGYGDAWDWLHDVEVAA